MIRPLNFGVWAIIIFVSSCVTKTVNSKKQNADLLEVRWNLVELYGKPFDSTEYGNVYFVLNGDSTLFGFAGCNRFMGKAKVTPSEIIFGDLASTRMYCPIMHVENNLMKLISGVVKYQIDEHELIVTKIGPEVGARFIASPIE